MFGPWNQANNNTIPSVCTVCSYAISEGQPIFTLPCLHSFHRDCITTISLHGNRLCPLCLARLPESLTVTTFDDDESLPFQPRPAPPSAPLHPSSSPNAVATINTFPEFPAIAASASPSDFAVLVKTRAPPEHPSSGDRTPIDLVAVLDVSGSMDGQKLALLKRAVRFIIDTLGPSDRLSIVTFSTDARRVLNLCCMSDPGRVRASLAVHALAAEGWTNIKAGLEIGVRVLDERRYKNPVAGLILLSDGQDNRSIRHSGRHHHPRVEGYSHLLPSDTVTVPIHTFGFGSDHDPRAMHAIADASGGTFSFIEAEEEIQDAFAMCIGGLLSVVAQQVELMVNSASDGVLITSVDSGSYRSKVLNHGLAAAIEVGDLYADEEKDFLVHLSVPVKLQQDELTMPLLTVKCSYKNPLNQEAVHVEGETVVIRRPEDLSPEDQAVSLIVDGQRNRILVAESIREAQARAERGDFEGAKAVLTKRRSELLGSASARAGDGLCGWLDTELQEVEKRMADVHVYRRSGRAFALSGMRSHMQQKAASGAIASTANAYMMAMNCPESSNLLPTGGAGAAPVTGGSGGTTITNVGYHTLAMRKMVMKSQQYARENPLEPSLEQQQGHPSK